MGGDLQIALVLKLFSIPTLYNSRILSVRDLDDYITPLPLRPTMSRSAADATRFTATSPHAYSKTFLRSPPSSANPPSRSNTNPHRFSNPNAPRYPAPGPKNIPPAETPAEKVARLRSSRLAEKEAQISKWDKIVVRGRLWADRAHKATAYSLISFSGMLALLHHNGCSP